MSRLQDYLNNEWSPLSGGNTLQTVAKEEAIDNFALENLREMSQSTGSSSFGYSYSFYAMINFEADWYVGKYPVNSADRRLNEVVMEVIRRAFFSGIAGFMMDPITREYKAVTIRKLEYKYNLIKRFEYTEDIETDSPLMSSPKTTWKTATEEELPNIAICRWGYGWRGQGAWVFLNPYIRQQEFLYSQIYTYSKLLMKKIVYHVQNPAAAKTELEIFNDISPFIFNIKPDYMNGEALRNKFEEWGIDSKDALLIFEFIERFQKSYAALLGRNFNVDGKVSGERNLTSEINVSQSNLDQIQNTTDQLIGDFLKAVEEMTGVIIEQGGETYESTGTNGIY